MLPVAVGAAKGFLRFFRGFRGRFESGGLACYLAFLDSCQMAAGRLSGCAWRVVGSMRFRTAMLGEL